jgi:hypothetical protein
MFMPAGISSEMYVSHGMGMPIGMPSFPAMKPGQTERFADQPNVARS